MSLFQISPALTALTVSGADARDFLQRQLTSDIGGLAADQAQYSAWCTAKGRVITSLIVWAAPTEAGECVRLVVPADQADFVIKRLQLYIIRAKVKISIDEAATTLGVCASDTQALETWWHNQPNLPALPLATMSCQVNDQVEVVRLRSAADSVRLLFYGKQPQLAALTNGLAAGNNTDWVLHDIAAAVAWISASNRDAFVPQMIDLERIGGLSFQKGCYPGQEVVARSQYIGRVKRHLSVVSCNGALTAGESLHHADDETALGRIIEPATTPEGSKALAVVHENAGQSLRTASGLPLTVTAIDDGTAPT